MKKLLLPIFSLCLLLSLPQSALGQELVPFETLQFANDFERATFQKLSQGDTNYTALLLAASGRLDAGTAQAYSEKMEALYQSLDSAKLMRKSAKKIVKTIFNTIHDNLFVKYEEENQFCEIFETGYYNCVSATAMYSYMFKRLGVPYQIIEAPNHVYVMAYPKEETWVIESTDPQQGYYELADNSDELYVRYLIEQKMITESQASLRNPADIVNEFNPTAPIDYRRLAAIQYHNQAIYDSEANRFYEGIKNHLKARYIDPTADYTGVSYIFLSWIEKEQYNNPQFFDILPWVFYTVTEEERLEMLNNLEYYGQQYNLGKLNEEQFNAFFDVLDTVYSYNDSALKVVREKRMLALTVMAIQNGQAKAASSNVRKLMDSNPSDFRHQSLFLASLGLLINNGSWTDETALDSVEMLHNRYPELKDFGLWKNLVAELYLLEAVGAINRKNLSLAEKHLNRLEEILQGEVPEAVNEELVAIAYSKVAHYSYRRSKSKALYWVEQGLRYSPNSSLLLGLKDFYNKR